MKRYNDTRARNIKLLEQYIPVVDRVHGEHHPEFHDVRRIFEKLNEKVKSTGAGISELDNEFKKLREITDHYTVPDDVCESYEAVYNMLAEIDEAYHSQVDQ